LGNIYVRGSPDQASNGWNGVACRAGGLCGFRPVSVSAENVALGGYDTVAYFTIGEAVKGSPAYSVTWRRASWRFSSKTNMKKFRADPEKFAPAFGGYCSFAVAEGMTVSCDPEAFLIRDGKLYVMKNKDILRIWQKDPDGYLEAVPKPNNSVQVDYCLILRNVSQTGCAIFPILINVSAC